MQAEGDSFVSLLFFIHLITSYMGDICLAFHCGFLCVVTVMLLFVCVVVCLYATGFLTGWFSMVTNGLSASGFLTNWLVFHDHDVVFHDRKMLSSVLFFYL